MPDARQQFPVLLAGDLTYKEWEQLKEACKADKVPTFSTAKHICPTCKTTTPSTWEIYVREVDKDLAE